MWQAVNQPGNLAARIVEQVENLIREKRLKPGDQLPSERDMAVLLKVSRPSLREAMRMLEARGLLVVKHGVGVFVDDAQCGLPGSKMSHNELFAMREVLEVPAAAWAAERITAVQLARLRATLQDTAMIVDGPGETDFDRLATLDVQFHMGIATAAGNRFLHQTAGVLHNMLRSGMRTTLTIPGRALRSRREHESIYAALRAHDPVAARKATRAHIRGAHAAAISRVGPS
jgi:GntR family transcriptional repressor for pyruvate dehydrogenase complex